MVFVKRFLVAEEINQTVKFAKITLSVFQTTAIFILTVVKAVEIPNNHCFKMVKIVNRTLSVYLIGATLLLEVVNKNYKMVTIANRTMSVYRIGAIINVVLVMNL